MINRYFHLFVLAGFCLAGPLAAASEASRGLDESPKVQFEGGDGYADVTTADGVQETEHPEISVDPESVDFGEVFSGEDELELVKIENTGDADLVIGSVTIAGDPDFELLSSCSGNQISPGNDCSIVIEFNAAERGDFSAGITIPSNDPETPEVQVPVTGTVIAPVLDIQPLSLDFGAIRVGQTLDAGFMVHNDGDPGAPLILTSLALGGDDPQNFALVDAEPDSGGGATSCQVGMELDGGQACEVQVRFEPGQPGQFQAGVGIETDVDQAGDVSLAGSGLPTPDKLVMDFVVQPGDIVAPGESFSVQVQARYVDEGGVVHTVDYLEGETVEVSLVDNDFGGVLSGPTSGGLDDQGAHAFTGLSIDQPGTDYRLRARLEVSDASLAVPDFTLEAGAEFSWEATIGEVPDSRVIGLDFAGTVGGIGVDGTWASDLRMDVSGPSGSAFSVGGFDDPGEEQWDFFGPGSSEPGAYISHHANAFAPGTQDHGDWLLEFRHDLSVSNAVMSWSDVTVDLVRQSLVQDGFSNPFIVCDDSGTPVKVEFIGQPTNTLVGEVVEPQVSVRVLDCDGVQVGEPGLFVKLIVPGIDAEQISGNQTQVNEGVAVFEGLAIDQTGEDLRARVVLVDSAGEPVTGGPLGGQSQAFWVRTDFIFIDRFEHTGQPRQQDTPRDGFDR